jgi:hypothetical protein
MSTLWFVVSTPLWIAGLFAVVAGAFYAVAAIFGSPGTSLMWRGFPDGVVLLLAITLIASGSANWYFAALVALGHFAQ